MNKLSKLRSDFITNTVEVMREYDPSDDETFAEIVRNCIEVGLKPSILSNEFEVSESTISRWSRGKSSPVKLVRRAVVDRLVVLMFDKLEQRDRSA